MENSEFCFEEDLCVNAAETSGHLLDSAAGSEERVNEAKIYDMQMKSLLAMDKQIRESDFETERLGLERYKIDEELKLRRELEERRISIEESKAKTEKATLWGRLAIAGLEFGSGVGLGILYLKANMKYGGMIGKDGKKWFDDLRRIKL